MAFDASDGSLRWRGHAFGLTHGSPVGATFGGVRQVVFPDRYGLASVAQDDGRLLWRYRQGDSPGRHGPSPLISGDIVVCMKTDSSRWGAVRIGCTNGLFVTTTLWTNAAWADTYATAVVHGGCLYGLSRRGLDCRELPTGRPKWFTDQAANGSVVRAGERLVVLTQRGELVLIQPSESGYQEVSRCTVTTGAESLNSPALSGGRVYLRNPGEIVCVDAAPPAPLRLQAQLLPGTGRLSLQALGGDGQPIPAARAARIGVLTSPDLRVDPAQWTPLPLAPILTNGALVFEEPFAPASPARYYRAVETEE
jgi:outer membrane protein assembly factor BamB